MGGLGTLQLTSGFPSRRTSCYAETGSSAIKWSSLEANAQVRNQFATSPICLINPPGKHVGRTRFTSPHPQRLTVPNMRARYTMWTHRCLVSCYTPRNLRSSGCGAIISYYYFYLRAKTRCLCGPAFTMATLSPSRSSGFMT